MTMKKRLSLGWVISLSLVVSLCIGTMITGGTRAKSNIVSNAIAKHGGETQDKANKVSSDLRDRVRSAPSDDRVRVILQFNGPVSSALESLIQRNGGVTKGDFRTLNSRLILPLLDLLKRLLDCSARFVF